MKMAGFRQSYGESFLVAAKTEGWITDRREIDFLLGVYPEGCLVCLDEGRPIAFITAICYAPSAWIGNLLVLPEYRCRGIGRSLIEKVLVTLDQSGCETVWLTASADGAHLYRTLGFTQIDTIRRWRGQGRGELRSKRPHYIGRTAEIDSLGWGESRSSVFTALPERCGFFADSDGFLVLSSCNEGQQIGPWGALNPAAAAGLLARAIEGDSPCKEVCLDVPENNLDAGRLLSSKGFSVTGSTLLMFRGSLPEYRAGYVYSLASLGSYG